VSQNEAAKNSLKVPGSIFLDFMIV